MITRVYKLAATGTTTSNGAAQLRIQQSGVICTIVGNMIGLSAAAGSGLGMEISFAATGQVNVNDTVGPLWGMDLYGTFTAAGTGMCSANLSTTGLYIPVQSGDLIYMNLQVFTGGFTSGAQQCYLYVCSR